MDDTCAVCADSLEWVAYGICGHKDVCSTCVARLRFICSDNCCCICKTESKMIFVTKALGDYTKNISDFSVFPSEPKEGRSGQYWYHEDTQAYFDDLDQYKMIKAMCRLSCSVCDNAEGENAAKKRVRFRNINQLKGHLFHQHNVFMCSLCLEGRKVFICEQKLYSKAQLKQHINTGDTEVDGTESERGGFQGHPICEFCRTPFYGDNELYTHMNTEHFNCHICRRQNPGKYEYYKNYEDLENHFRGEHFLCEDEGCLSKKFIVFTSEAEMKRHNAQEHGGHMSRSQRNAALQIPTSFTYRRSNEQDNRRGRRNIFQRDLSEAELSQAIEASLHTANASSSVVSDHADANGFDPLIQSFEGLGTDADPPSRYLMAVSHRTRNSALEESAFPPLSTGPGASSQRPDGLPRNTMADNIRRQNKKKINVLNTGHAWPAAARSSNNQSSSSSVSRPQNTGSSSVSRPANTGSLVIPGQRKSMANPIQVLAPPAVTSSSSTTWKTTSKISHSTSAPNLVDTGSAANFPPVSAANLSQVSASDFPPVSALQTRTAPVNPPATKSVQEVYAANKSMVEKIREGLNHDQDKYDDFKQVSAEYRQGVINAETYLVYVDQFGLSNLVPDLARLLPDPNKEKELMAIYNANQAMSAKGNGRKNKGKSVTTSENSSTNKLTNSILSTVREFQSNYRPDEEVETLSKDGYRVANKGKSKAEVDDRASPGVHLVLKPPKNEGGGGSSGGGDGEGKSKQKQKKTSKFLRARLGNGSISALDLTNGGSDSGASNGYQDPDPNEAVPVRGVWRNGGGHKLIVKDQKRP